MNKSRLEAFSDGVIAILITIMVLELKVPHAADWQALRPLLPVFLTYILSFSFLGIYWNNHHHMLHATERINGAILWANLHLLFWLSLIPFGTGWMGQNHAAPLPTALYGVVLLMAAIAYTILQTAIVAHQGPHSKLREAVGGDLKGKISIASCLAAIPLAFARSWIAIGLYVFVALLWAAARRLLQAGRRVLVLEGRDRIGGRAFTDTTTFRRPWDHGCHWLHSPEENPFTRSADDYGFVYARQAAPGGIYAGGARLPPGEERAAIAFRERTFAAIRRAGTGGADRPVSEIIDSTHPAAAYAAHAFTAKMGIEPREASARDFANYRWIGEDRPVRDGFGALVRRCFAEVPVTLGARERRIDLTGARPRVESDAGTSEAPQVLITVSTGVLRAEAIAFTPRLPDWKLRAIEALPMARALKVGLEFARDVTGIAGPAFLTAMARHGRDAMDVEIWPAGWDGVTRYLDGDLALRLEQAGGRAVEEYALETLAGMFGTSIQAALRTSARTGWNQDDLTHGTYSAPLPGHADARAALGRPLDGRLFFAGEAIPLAWSGDVHGAYQSGIDAAEAMLHQ